MGKFLLGALVGAGLAGALGAWLGGRVPTDPPPLAEAWQVARELQRVRLELRAAEIDRNRSEGLGQTQLDFLQACKPIRESGVDARVEIPTSPDWTPRSVP